MSSVADLVAPIHLSALANPATLRLGREIVNAGAVELLASEPLRVRGKVGGGAQGQVRTTELRVVNNTLEWSCTCNRKQAPFCKHCVALAIRACLAE